MADVQSIYAAQTSALLDTVLPSAAATPTPLPMIDPRVERLRTSALYVAAASAVVGGWAAAIWLSQHIEPDPLLHEIALFVHLAALVAGMGAVLSLDWFGARWLLGHHEREDVMRLAGGSHALIWGGLVGLTVSGVFLTPNLSAPMTLYKLGAVLIVALNGVHAHLLQRQLEAATAMTPRLLLRAGMVASVSQLGWWSAFVIGFINAR